MPRARRWEAIVAAFVAAIVVLGLLVWGGDADRGATASHEESAPSGGPELHAGPPRERSPDSTSPLATDRTATRATATNGGAGSSSGASPTKIDRPARAPDSKPQVRRGGAGAGVIRGRVEGTDGTPLAHKSVFVRPFDDRQPGKDVRTDAFGAFTAEVPAPGWYQVWVLGGLRGGRNFSNASRRVFVRPGRRTEVIVVPLQPAPTIRFVPPPRPGDRVLLEFARPKDQLQAALDRQTPRLHQADGVLPLLEPTAYHLTYFASGGRTSHHRIELRPGESVVTPNLQGPGRVVVDARDAKDARVEVRVRFRPIGRSVLYRPLGPSGPLRPIERVEFTIRRDRALEIPAGRYHLTTLSSPAGLETPTADVTVASEQRQVVNLRLRPATTVEVPLDVPWPTGGGTILGKPGWSVEQPTQQGGPLRIHGVADAGALLVRLGDRIGEVRVAPGTRPFLRLEPCGSVRLQIKRGAHPDSAKTFVAFTYLRPLVDLTSGVRTEPDLWDFTDTDGRVTQKLFPGRWKIEAAGKSIQVTVPTRIRVDTTLRLAEQ